MRNQFYGDRLCVAKWSGVRRELCRDTRPTRMLYVPMMRPDEGTSEGRQMQDVADAAPDVVQFFHGERIDFMSAPELRRANRVQELVKKWDVPFQGIWTKYEPRDTEYFREVLRALCADLYKEHRTIVVLDPDTGLSTPRKHQADTKRLGKEDLVRVWNNLRAGDTVAVYQHSQHYTQGERRQHLAGFLGIREEDVRSHDFRVGAWLFAASR